MRTTQGELKIAVLEEKSVGHGEVHVKQEHASLEDPCLKPQIAHVMPSHGAAAVPFASQARLQQGRIQRKVLLQLTDTIRAQITL
jgi:hypothetical protein